MTMEALLLIFPYFLFGFLSAIVLIFFLAQKNPSFLSTLLKLHIKVPLEDFNEMKMIPLIQKNTLPENEKPIREKEKCLLQGKIRNNTQILAVAPNNPSIIQVEPPLKNWMHLSHAPFWRHHYFCLKGEWLCYYNGIS